MDGWMEGWMDGLMDGWIDRSNLIGRYISGSLVKSLMAQSTGSNVINWIVITGGASVRLKPLAMGFN